MQKLSKQRLGTAGLILLFLTGLFMAVWPVAIEMVSYRIDDEEYEAIAADLRPADPSPIPVLPVTEPTQEPSEESQQPVEDPSVEITALPSETGIPTDPPVSEQPETIQPSIPPASEAPILITTAVPTEVPTIVPLFSATSTPTAAVVENKPTPSAKPTATPPKATEQPQAGVPYLDGEYTVFGEVFSGLDVVDKIQRVSTDDNGKPTEDVKIISVKVL